MVSKLCLGILYTPSSADGLLAMEGRAVTDSEIFSSFGLTFKTFLLNSFKKSNRSNDFFGFS